MPDIFSDPQLLKALLDATSASDTEERTESEPKSKGIGVAPYAALAAGQGADVWSTAGALNRGGKEGNSGLYGKHPSVGRMIGTKAAVTIPAMLAMHKIGKTNPKIAKTIGYGGGILGGLLAAMNSRVGK